MSKLNWERMDLVQPSFHFIAFILSHHYLEVFKSADPLNELSALGLELMTRWAPSEEDEEVADLVPQPVEADSEPVHGEREQRPIVKGHLMGLSSEPLDHRGSDDGGRHLVQDLEGRRDVGAVEILHHENCRREVPFSKLVEAKEKKTEEPQKLQKEQKLKKKRMQQKSSIAVFKSATILRRSEQLEIGTEKG